MPSVFQVFLLILLPPAPAAPPEILLYASFDSTTTARGPVYNQPNVFCQPFPRPETRLVDGLVGKAARFGPDSHGAQLVYPLDPNFDRSRGTLCFWLRVLEDGTETGRAGALISKNLLPSPFGFRLCEQLKTDEWTHFASEWDLSRGSRKFYLDGKEIGSIPMAGPLEGSCFALGQDSFLDVDEVYLFDLALPPEQIMDFVRKGKEGQTWRASRFLPRGGESFYPLRLPLAHPKLSDVPPGEEPRLQTLVEISPHGLRRKYRLGGLWRVLPVSLKNPLVRGIDSFYLRMPGEWKGEQAALLGLDLQPVPAGRAPRQCAAAWLERMFVVPEEKADRRYWLHLDGVHSSGGGEYPTDIYLNGRYVGNIHGGEKRSMEISRLVQPRGLNRLLLLNGRPYYSVVRAGISREVVLETGPAGGPAFDGPLFLKAAAGEKQLGADFALTGTTGGKPLELWAVLQDEGKVRDPEQLGPVPLPVKKEQTLSVWFPWPNARYWSAGKPELFRVSLQVRQGEKILDEMFSQRFGFRELGVSGGSLLLNGRPLGLRGRQFDGSGGGALSEGFIRSSKRLGFNTCTGLDWSVLEAETTLDMADQMGWYVSCPLVPAPSWFLPGPNEEPARRFYAARLERFANHPSLILWRLPDSGAVAGPAGHPRELATDSGGPLGDAARHISRVLHELDPTRPNTFALAGAGGDVRSTVQHFGPVPDIQSQEEYPRAWAAKASEPLLISDAGSMLLPYFYLWQRAEGQRGAAVAEHAARYLGSRAYRTISALDLLALHRPIEQTRNHWRQHPVIDDLAASACARLIRSWRAYGASFILRTGSLPPLYRSDLQLSLFGEAVARWNGPVIAFIAGPPEDFVTKDHSYFSEETVRKQVVLINDLEENIGASVEVEWRFASGSNTATRRSRLGATLQPGQIMGLPVEFSLPVVADRTALSLKAKVKILRPGGGPTEELEDEAHLTVFPRFKIAPALAGRRILLIDYEGSLKKVLDAAEVPSRALDEKTDLAQQDLVLFGRGSAQPEALEFLRLKGLEKQVRQGLNVVLFEQPFEKCFGLEAETFASRRAFIRATDSPLLQGFSDEDFANWRGPTTINEAYPPWRPGDSWLPYHTERQGHVNALGQWRFWHWSNLGTVATLCYRKPQRGNFRVLLDNGFDQLYSPLIEFQIGRGRVLFCQLDVTGRYGIDPVATLLVQRILGQYSERGTQELALAYYAGGEKGAALLSRLGVPSESFLRPAKQQLELNRPLVLSRPDSPFSKAQLLRIQTFVARGGKLLQLGASKPEDKAWLPGNVRFRTGRVYRTEIPDLFPFGGLGDADFFWRRPAICPVITLVPPRGRRLSSGALALVPFGRGLSVFCQFDPRTFSDPWSQAKAFRILAVLLTNLGAKSSVGIFTGPDDNTPTAGPYILPAVGFDPDEHRLLDSGGMLKLGPQPDDLGDKAVPNGK